MEERVPFKLIKALKWKPLKTNVVLKIYLRSYKTWCGENELPCSYMQLEMDKYQAFMLVL